MISGFGMCSFYYIYQGAKWTSSKFQHMVKGNQHNIGYYLADEIHSDCICEVNINVYLHKDKLYAHEQEEARNDIDRALIYCIIDFAF
jgi:hypothetical protein